MPKEEVAKYNALLKEQRALRHVAGAALVLDGGGRQALSEAEELRPDHRRSEDGRRWTIRSSPASRFSREDIDFRDGRREAFVEWLTAPENPLFARVAVNRIWGWHFGEGLQRVTSDFGVLGGTPSNPKLLDYLASEFVAHDYSMKWLHRLIVTSDTYQLSSKAEPAQVDEEHGRSTPATPICGISACSVWRRSRSGMRFIMPPAIWIWRSAASRSSSRNADQKQRIFLRERGSADSRTNRRGVYMMRGYIPSTDVMNNFLTSFDVDDGRTVLPDPHADGDGSAGAVHDERRPGGEGIGEAGGAES